MLKVVLHDKGLNILSGKNKQYITNLLSAESAHRVLELTHLSLETPKREIGKQYRPRLDAAAECSILSGFTPFAYNTGNFYKTL